MKIQYILTLLLITISVSCAEKQKKSKPDSIVPPNVIIVITDDQGYGDLGHTGNQIIKTPAIDKFSEQSFNLSNYHVGTTCAPTRAGMLTGRNSNRNGVWHTIMGASILNRDETTMAEVFQKNGYKTAMFGKWHLGDNHPFLPEDRGFDEAFYHGGGGIGQTPDYWNNDYFDDTYFRNGKPEKKEGYCTDVWFDEAMQFIKSKKDQPFFCYLSLNAPHSPFNLPEEYYNLYKDEDRLTEKYKRFYGMITNIDDNFSKLLKQLEVLNIAENTILIFTTDNGTTMNYKFKEEEGQYYSYNAYMRGIKASPYDGGHRVPFIVRWPEGGLVGGKKLHELTAHVDILPTLATLAGLDYTPTKTMDGADISGYLMGRELPKDRFLVTDTQRVPWPIKGKQSCVMRGNWRLVNGTELYNIAEDLGQRNNLADQNPRMVQEMNAFYETWWADVIKEMKYSKIDLGVESLDVITCHDAHTGDMYPAWNQNLIRAGESMPPSKFLVNFVKRGKYKFRLMRWPIESGLNLGDKILDGVAATSNMEKKEDGISMLFKKAYLKIGEQTYTVDVNNSDQAATLEVEVEKGETELLAYFDLENGMQSNAFYVYTEWISEL